ncbi:MAG: hypothetical protein AB7S87_16900 [Burkholderiales bacterium]
MNRGVLLEHIASWGGGAVYWAFDTLIAVRPGAMLLLPARKAVGDLRLAIAACPVSYESVLAALDPGHPWRPVVDLDVSPAVAFAQVHAMAGPGGWSGAPLPTFKSRLYQHDVGLRLAVAQDLIRNENGRSHHEAANA